MTQWQVGHFVEYRNQTAAEISRFGRVLISRVVFNSMLSWGAGTALASPQTIPISRKRRGMPMHSQMKVIRAGDEIALSCRNAGRALFWLLVLEIALLGGILLELSSVVSSAGLLAFAVIVCGALMVWTAVQIKPDCRITAHLGSREAQVVKIAPLTGATTAASFRLDDMECLTLLQTVGSYGRNNTPNEYVVAVQLRDGECHVLSARGPMLAYVREVGRFCEAVGVGTRVVRLPAPA